MKKRAILLFFCAASCERGRFRTRAEDDCVRADTEPRANIWAERHGGDPWIIPDIRSSHPEDEYWQEPFQAWLIVKKIRHILRFPQFHKIRTESAPPFFCIFNHFKMAFCVHSLSVQAFIRCLTERRGDDMQSCSTNGQRPFSCTSYKRPSSGSAYRDDRRSPCERDGTRGS